MHRLVLMACCVAAGFAGGEGVALWRQPPPAPVVGPGAVQYQVTVDRQVARSRLADGAVFLFGNSHVVALPGAHLGAENFGINSDTAAGLLARLPQYDLQRASGFVVAIGANDVGRVGTKEFGAVYRRALALLPAGKPVIATALFPAPGVAPYTAEVAKACRARRGCRLLDISRDLEAHLGPDGVHLSPSGGRLWAGRLKEMLGR